MYSIKIALLKLLQIIDLLILVRLIISFLPSFRYSKIGNLIYEITEPILAPCRNLIYKLGIDTGMFDFSPIVAYLILGLVRRIIYLIF